MTRKLAQSKTSSDLAVELRSLVHESVALLGHVIKRKLGAIEFQKIETIRQQMTHLRDGSDVQSLKTLEDLLAKLKKNTSVQRYSIAHAYTLMLELMNASENAYRSFRLTKYQNQKLLDPVPKSITYVLTAHPTEARSPQNIDIFHQIQNLLTEILESNLPGKKIILKENQKNDLLHLLEIAWRTPIVRLRSPKVKDEAEFLYSQVFRDNVLFSLINANDGKIPFSLHSWVGGDKDGHPGVDEKTLIQSLSLSRGFIIKLFNLQMIQVRDVLELTSGLESQSILKLISRIQAKVKSVRVLSAGDFKKIDTIKNLVRLLNTIYLENFGSLHPSLRKINQILELFPALVIPIELRESSDVLMSKPIKGKSLAIDRMLKKIAMLSKDFDPSVYVRSFIISMTQNIDHVRAAATKQIAAFGAIRLPIVPLFEDAQSLMASHEIMVEVLSDTQLNAAIKKYWHSRVEMMVGYSDSSKEAGVLPSRLGIAEALPRLERVCQDAGFTAIFFHGSGGSVDRGGGSIEDQTAWWPRSGVENYKVTVQGEMVERSMASSMIARRQLEKIALSASHVLRKPFQPVDNSGLDVFVQKITEAYRSKIADPDFLKVVASATPYSYINYLKIGSRPAKRNQQLVITGLRAIPWILCWTQTRLLFPTWWGVGTAWSQSSDSQKKNLKRAFQTEAAFASYIKALDFTLAKIELSVFKIYLNQSGLPPASIQKFAKEVEFEFHQTRKFCLFMTGASEFLAYKSWLRESVELRSPMIHPLNCLQILALKEHDIALLRLTVTGISSGMMSTG